ncbi:MAG: DUF1858 domain-containing protein [Nanoarchaeota archaeon]|nr:DUF1858 domain-containing protein [Nanoarchaeota archaeon]
MKITEEMSIYDITNKYPVTARVFVDYGLFCVGCVASSVETLKQGVLGHGISEEVFYEILEKLNAVVEKEDKNLSDGEKEIYGFFVSEDAGLKLEEIKKRNREICDKEYLRVSASSVDNYDMTFTDIKGEKDIIFYLENLKVIIDKKSFEILDGFELGYKKSEFGEGFVFERRI